MVWEYDSIQKSECMRMKKVCSLKYSFACDEHGFFLFEFRYKVEFFWLIIYFLAVLTGLFF